VVRRFIKFSIVGFSGILVNMAVYALAVQNGLHYLAAAMLAFLFAVTSNFYWNLRWTFRGYAVTRSLWNRYGRFIGICGINLGINLVLLGAFVEKFDMNINFAQFLAIGTVSVLNFVMNDRFTFGENKNSLSGNWVKREES